MYQHYVFMCLPSSLLLHLDPAPTEYETDTVEIFGFPWVTETALVDSTKVLFGLFRYCKPGCVLDLNQNI